MLRVMNSIEIAVDKGTVLQMNYKPTNETSIYDLCDHDGKLLATGNIESKVTELNIASLTEGDYYIFILDGPEIVSHKFAV